MKCISYLLIFLKAESMVVNVFTNLELYQVEDCLSRLWILLEDKTYFYVRATADWKSGTIYQSSNWNDLNMIFKHLDPMELKAGTYLSFSSLAKLHSPFRWGTCCHPAACPPTAHTDFEEWSHPIDSWIHGAQSQSSLILFSSSIQFSLMSSTWVNYLNIFFR